MKILEGHFAASGIVILLFTIGQLFGRVEGAALIQIICAVLMTLFVTNLIQPTIESIGKSHGN